VSPQQATADVIDLRDFVERQDVSPTDKLRRIARDLEALRVLNSATSLAQVATGDAMGAISTMLDEQIAPAVIRLENAVGKEPNPKALERASSLDLSPEEVARAELGTGLHRRISDVQVKLGGLDRKLAVAGFATASAAAVLPAIFAALPGAAQVASGVVLALVTGLAGVWAARKKAPAALPPKEG
jgi:hypothetical protein